MLQQQTEWLGPNNTAKQADIDHCSLSVPLVSPLGYYKKCDFTVIWETTCSSLRIIFLGLSQSSLTFLRLHLWSTQQHVRVPSGLYLIPAPVWGAGPVPLERRAQWCSSGAPGAAAAPALCLQHNALGCASTLPPSCKGSSSGFGDCGANLNCLQPQ